MIIESLTLKNFRSHNYASFDFKNGINVITGPNACGKTTVVEAIYYLSLARSFRANDDDNLIQVGKERSDIEAIVRNGSLKRNIHIVIDKNFKKIFVNDKPVKRLSELAKINNVIVFEPKDVLFFKDNPRIRRSFIDISISKQSPSYFDYISRYDKVLKERNELLKQDNVDKVLLETTTEMLIKLSGPIVSYRQMYLKNINDILNQVIKEISNKNMELVVVYRPFVPYTKEFNKNALELFAKSQDNDIRKKSTNVGIHREDIRVNLNGKDVASFASQGENRLIALALKLSPYFLIENSGDRPIIILDDAMSELDELHQKKLIAFIKKFEQVFITATRLEIKGASHYQIKENK